LYFSPKPLKSNSLGKLKLYTIIEIKIEIIVDDKNVKKAVETIQKSAKTDKIGDGKIFVTNVEEAIRIRTGEKGSDAI